MTSAHNIKSLSLNSDDNILDLLLSSDPPDPSLFAPNSIPLTFPASTSVSPIQSFTSLKSEADAFNISQETLVSIKKTEIEAVFLASSTPPQILRAQELLDKLIKQYPFYPSAYNNRAQVKQIKALGIEHFSNELNIAPQNPSSSAAAAPSSAEAPSPLQLAKMAKMLRLEALSDLNQCIQLCYQLYPLFAPQHSAELLAAQELLQRGEKLPSGADCISIPQVLVLSLSQRAILHKLRGNEQSAHSDLRQAAALGGKVAQSELDQMNVFEKLNKDTLHKLLKQYYDDLSTQNDVNIQQLKDQEDQQNNKNIN